MAYEGSDLVKLFEERRERHILETNDIYIERKHLETIEKVVVHAYIDTHSPDK